ncbi:MAG: hypothetical protein WD048_03265 [Chitinophagales bacterium]
MNFTKTGLLLILALVLFFIFSCSKKNSDYQPDYQYDYYPVDTGHYVIYQVDSITFDNNFNPPRSDTNRYQIREYIESIFIDNEGREANRIERYVRKDSTQSWRIKNAWYSVLNQTSAERIEENLRFIKLVFPPDVGQTWRGNKFLKITPEIDYYEGWEYEITETGVPATVNGNTFSETLLVAHIDEENLIEKTFSEERYARGVGLIEREFLHLEKQNVSNPWSKPESGFILRMNILDYKK